MTTAPIGHNNQPPYDLDAFQPLEARAREIADAGAAWITLAAIETEEQAQKANDFLAQVRKIEKDADAERKAQKQPHMDAGAEVDKAFKGLLEPLSKIAGKIKPALTAFVQAKEKADLAEKARLADEARNAEEAAAQKLRQAQERGDVFGEAEAEQAAKDAADMAKAAAKAPKTQVSSATGGVRTMALRTTYRAEVTNMNQAFSFFRDHEKYGPELHEIVTRMAEAERRSASGVNEIPGIKFTEERKIA